MIKGERSMLKRLYGFSMLYLLTYCSIYGQLTTSELKVSAQEIKQERPQISERALEQDITKISGNFPTIQREFIRLGFNEQATNKAVISGWEYVRLESPLQSNRSLNSNSFIEFMRTEFLVRYGLVTFQSEPSEAEILVEGESLGKSVLEKWYPVGQITVICKKDGFEDGSNTCPVLRGTNNCPCALKSRS